MRIVPDSTITLYAGVDIDNGEQLVFSSREKQADYFTSKLVRAKVPCTMVQKSGIVRLEVPGSVVSTCNYLSFVNPSFDNKTVYARIIDYDYINNECVEISYAIDYWQTWMFDVTFENMYIEREHLSQADFAKAEINPYDPTIFEFKTAETLPIAPDLEKKMYTIGNDDTTDGLKAGSALNDVIHIDGTMGVFIKLAEIDFEDLDSVDPDTSKPFAEYLEKIGNRTFGYYRLTDKMGHYLSNKYPSGGSGPHVSYVENGQGWRDAGIVPVSSTTRFTPSCVMIYDPLGGDEVTGNGNMSELLTVLTKLKAVDQIISMHIIPNNLFAYSCEQVSTGDPEEMAGVVKVAQKTAKTTLPIQVTNRKLMRYPFSYIREIAPNGDIKELHYEDFKEIMDGTEDFGRINCVLDVSDQPTLILAPYKYRMTGIGHNTQYDDANILESIVFAQFPTAPYNIDAYLAQVAAEAVNSIAGRTEDAAWSLTNELESTSKQSQLLSRLAMGTNAALGSDPSFDVGLEPYGGGSKIKYKFYGTGDVSATGAIRGAVNSAAAGYQAGIDFTTRSGLANNAAYRWIGADSALGGDDWNIIAHQLRLTKPAYACNKYYMSNGCGTINFNNVSFCDIAVLRVQLNSDILALYDNWFSMYGYTSGRCGIPRVINFMHGDTAQADIPAWATVNNKPTTYIKTMDCKVIHSMIPVASFIKNMFDSGVRLIKGDLENE